MGIIIVMIVTLTLFSLYINKKEKRSATSYVGEKLLQISIKKLQEELGKESEAYLEKQRKKNEEPYTLPIKGLAHSKIALEVIDGIDVVTFTPRKKESGGTLLYLHGGGYVEHASILHFFFIDSIQKLFPCKVVMPLYPKAPSHNAKEAVLKTKNLYEKMYKEEQHTLFVIGDSAGGGLALAVMQEVESQPKGIILISPWLDISLNNPLIHDVQDKDPMLSVIHLKNMGIPYRGELDERDSKVSPLFGDISHLAPLTLFVGTHEIFLPDVRSFYLRCLKEGKEVLYIEKERMNHDYPLFPMKEGKEAVAIIAKVLME